jgi:nucleoid DNA-binding protein
MIKIDIVKRVAEALNIKDREALQVVDTIIESIKTTIKEHGRIEIRNFGVFHVKQRKPRTGRNPRNKKEYPIKPRKVVTFKLGKELKDFSVEGADGKNQGSGGGTGGGSSFLSGDESRS